MKSTKKHTNSPHNLIIIGGGASGLMAGFCQQNSDFAILESSQMVGKKLAICGGGYANVTNKNITTDDYRADQSFIDRVLTKNNQKWLLNFFIDHKIELVIKNKTQYFCKNRATEFVNFFYNKLKNNIKVNTKVLSVSKIDNLFVIKSDQGTFTSKNVLVATGSPTYPILGSSSIARDIVTSFDHSFIEFAPALVGLTLQADQHWMRELSGVSTDVLIRVADRLIRGDLLFTHKGVSGPAVLDSSLWWQKGEISIDFLPDFDLEKFIKNNQTKELISLDKLPKRFIKAFMEKEQIEKKSFNKLSSDQLNKIYKLKNYSFAPAGNFGLTKAEVCRGGVSTSEIDPQTMMSKKVAGLYFAGEAVDVAGRVGGFNLAWAFISAKVAASSVKN